MTTHKNEAERIAILMKTPEKVRKGAIAALRALLFAAALGACGPASAQADNNLTCKGMLENMDAYVPSICADPNTPNDQWSMHFESEGQVNPNVIASFPLHIDYPPMQPDPIDWGKASEICQKNRPIVPEGPEPDGSTSYSGFEYGPYPQAFAVICPVVDAHNLEEQRHHSAIEQERKAVESLQQQSQLIGLLGVFK